jgi:hypothetical protein
MVSHRQSSLGGRVALPGSL